MRKVFLVLAVLAAFGMLAPPAMAQAPAPKVTITGLVHFVASVGKNAYDNDITDGGKDQIAFTRERGRFEITGEVGKTKGVWAFEMDHSNGFGAVAARGTTTGANFDLDTDIAGVIESRWLYLETPFTGPGSLMPFIPVPTTGRFGGQPAQGHDLKPGILFSGDFPGINLVTTWAPNIRTFLTFAQIQEKVERVSAPGQRESEAFLFSVHWDVFKGLLVKPTYAYAGYDGGNGGTANLGNHPKNGFNPNTLGLRTDKHTIGGDVRWTSGPFSLHPTFLYQFGDQEINPTCIGATATPAGCGAAGGRLRDEVDIRSWLFDVIGGFRTGPLNLQARFSYTPGMAAQHMVVNGSDINYYQAINPAFIFWAGWSEIETSGVDFTGTFLNGVSGVGLRNAPSYDKYGRIMLAGAADYSLTPALTLHALLKVSWTEEDVDTSGVLSANGLTSPRTRGTRDEEDYLGTELNVGFTYRFAPNIAFDFMGAYLFAGDALSHARSGTGGCRDRESAGSPACSADDIWELATRMQFTF